MTSSIMTSVEVFFEHRDDVYGLIKAQELVEDCTQAT